MNREASAVLPGLTLLLARPVPGSAAAAFRELIRARLGQGSGSVVLDQDLLERSGMAAGGPFSRANFERWLAWQALEALRAGGAERRVRARFPIFVVGFLTEPLMRRGALELPAQLSAALGRITLPRGMEPLPIALWLLPDRWTPLQGAELFAWLKEFAGALDTAGEELEARRGYTLNLVLGRSEIHGPESGGVLNHSDHALALRAAEFITACHTTRALDWALAVGRGMHRHGRFHSLGIAPLPPPAQRGGRDALAQALLGSQVLWPTESPTHHSVAWVGRAVIGVRVDDPPEEPLEGWDRVTPIEEAVDPPGRWLCRLAFGLEPRDLLGAEDWRGHYRRLPTERRRELHGVPTGAELPDPLARPAIDEIEQDTWSPVLPVL